MNAQNSRWLNLLLALAVIAGSLAWAPAPLAAPGDPEDPEITQGVPWPDRYRGKISASIFGDEVVLRGEQLPRRHVFFVKVRRSLTGSWTRVGVTKSSRNGDLQDRFRLPQSLRKASIVRVCIKDIETNRAYCAVARR